jgi:hypothetical protein
MLPSKMFLYKTLWLLGIVAIINLNSCSGQDEDLMPGKERWKIKTSVPAHSAAKKISLTDLLKLPAPIYKYSHDRFNTSRIMDSVEYNGTYYKEGDIITTTGYIHLVALEKDEKKTDGDYHIQVLPGPDWVDSCLIIEIPFHKFIEHDELLKEEVKKARKYVYKEILKGKENPRGKTISPAAYVKITGQLFFDGSHLHGSYRGKQNPDTKQPMKSYTCWEIHPVMEIEAATHK